MKIPRVCLYYWVVSNTGWRNDGCPLYLNYNLRKILNGDANMGDHTRNVVRSHPYACIETTQKFDLNILVDHGEDAIGVPLDFEYPHPNAYWISDAHLGYEHRLKTARQFDYVFCAQKWFIPRLAADGIPPERLIYLPHAFEQDVYKKLDMVPKWDWSFVGYPNSAHRIELLDRFIREFPNHYLGWRNAGVNGYNTFEDANEKFNKAKIVVNDAIKDDVNMRVFETLGTGSLLLTQRLPELEALFTDGEHLVMYDSLDQAVEQAKGILANEDLRQKISSAGHQEALKLHTYRERALTILDTCLGYKPEKVEELAKCL